MNQDTLKVHKRAAWLDEPATAKQRQYLSNVDIPHFPSITKGQAGILISGYQKSHPRTQITYSNIQRRVPAWLKDVIPCKESIKTWTCGLCNIRIKEGCHCPLCGAFEEGRCIICSSDHHYQSGVCDECLDRTDVLPIVLARFEDDYLLPIGAECNGSCSSDSGGCFFCSLWTWLEGLSPDDRKAALHDKDIVKLLLKDNSSILPIVCLLLDTPRKAIESGVRLAGFVERRDL